MLSLIVYVDDIVIIDDNANEIAWLTKFLQKNIFRPKIQTSSDISWVFKLLSLIRVSLYLKEYELDLLDETGLIGTRRIDTTMDPDVKL